MKERTKAELRKIAQVALKSEYGFSPSLKEIVLLEAYGDGSYILFEVNKNEYCFSSRVKDCDGSVYAGKGTIEKR